MEKPIHTMILQICWLFENQRHWKKESEKKDQKMNRWLIMQRYTCMTGLTPLNTHTRHMSLTLICFVFSGKIKLRNRQNSVYFTLPCRMANALAYTHHEYLEPQYYIPQQ